MSASLEDHYFRVQCNGTYMLYIPFQFGMIKKCLHLNIVQSIGLESHFNFIWGNFRWCRWWSTSSHLVDGRRISFALFPVNCLKFPVHFPPLQIRLYVVQTIHPYFIWGVHPTLWRINATPFGHMFYWLTMINIFTCYSLLESWFLPRFLLFSVGSNDIDPPSIDMVCDLPRYSNEWRSQ